MLGRSALGHHPETSWSPLTQALPACGCSPPTASARPAVGASPPPPAHGWERSEGRGQDGAQPYNVKSRVLGAYPLSRP